MMLINYVFCNKDGERKIVSSVMRNDVSKAYVLGFGYKLMKSLDCVKLLSWTITDW